MAIEDAGIGAATQEQLRIRKAGSLHWFHWVIVASSLVLTLSAWYFTNNQVQQKTHDQFLRQSSQVVELLTERLQKYEDALWAGVAAIKSQSSGIDHKEWQRFSNALRLEEKYPGINGIGVIYYIEADQLAPFLASEKQLRPKFRIHPAHDKTVFLPITYIEPIVNNAQAIGLDMAHETNRFTAAIKARDTNTAQITGPIVLVQDSEKTPGFLFYAPFYQGTYGSHTTLQGRKENFIGLVYAPFIFKKLLQGTLDETKRSVSLRIKDNNISLYDENSPTNNDFDPKPLYKKDISIDIYGRQWDFSIWSTKAFRQQNKNNQPILILVGGIIIDVLLLILFISIARSNRQAINLAQKLTLGYREKTADLKNANAELEEFAYRTSHDLRSPLTSSIGLLGSAKKAISQHEERKALLCINHADNSLNTLLQLIEDILSLTKAKNIDEEAQPINITDLLDNALQKLGHMENYERLSIQKNLQYDGTIITKKIRLAMIIENLLSNAIKYQDIRKSDSFIKISTQYDNGVLILSIEDNGLGIPKAHQQQLFSMFKRFHPTTSYGSGLGLYMIKKSTAIINAEINYNDTGNGSIFTLKISV
jgi:CHASE1-domain containing sensor protein/two-component sensor histidine kinase